MPIVSASFPAQATCPYCRATLRIREPQWLGRPTNCPECSQVLVLTLQDDGSVLAKGHATHQTQMIASRAPHPVVVNQSRPSRIREAATRKDTSASNGNRSTWSWRLSQPLLFGVVAIATTAFAAGTAVVVWSERGSDRGSSGGTSVVGTPASATDSNINPPQTNPQPPALPVVEQTVAEPARNSAGPATTGELTAALQPEQNEVLLPDAADTLIEALVVPEPATPELTVPETVGPPVVTIDLPGRLQTRLRRFVQPVRVSSAELLEVITDLLGVPINRSELQAAELARLNQPASTFDLSEVRVEQLLETILTPMDLTYRVEPAQLVLIPRTAPPSADR